jgi:hypothetical protein
MFGILDHGSPTRVTLELTNAGRWIILLIGAQVVAQRRNSMKTGYSILLGEYIYATAVEYRDCESFQIVCPSCKEPVFKCVREATGETVHYLSHYREKPSFDDRCELRVAAISTGHIEQQNGVSREQKLHYFLSILQDAILDSEFSAGSRIDRVRSFFRQIDRAKALGQFKMMVMEQCRDNWRGEDLGNHETYLDDYVRDIEESSGAFYQTAYSLQVQKRIAWDMWQCLLTPNSLPNLSFLFDHAYLMLMDRIDHAAQGHYSLFRGMRSRPPRWKRMLFR